MKILWLCAMAVFAVSVCAFAEEPKGGAPSTGAAVTLVGRGNRAAVVTKDGNVTEVKPNQLVFVNKSRGMLDWFTAPAPAAPAVKPPAQTNLVEEAEKAGREEGQKAVQEALLEADKKAIREMREGRYMWFFDEKGKQLTNEELDRRLATGNLSGIKAMNDDRDEWTPASARQEKK